LTCILSISKLLIVQFPLRTEAWSRKSMHIICALCYPLSLLMPAQLIIMIFTTKESIYFDYIHYVCFSDFFLTNTPIWFLKLAYIWGSVAVIVLLLLLIITSALLLLIAKRAATSRGGSVRWPGILAVILTTGMFLVSYLPDVIVSFLHPGQSLPTAVPLDSSIRRASSMFENLNVAANFFVYYCTFRSFREFLTKKIREFSRKQGSPSSSGKRRASRQARCQLSQGAQGNFSMEPVTGDTSIKE
jgi:hypothetical protein